MRSDAGPVGLAELSAYLDGELDEARYATVEKHIADHPEVAAELAGYRRRDDALRLAFAELGAEHAKRSRPRVKRAGSFGKRRFRFAVAAAIFGAILGTAGWWYVSAMLDDRALATLAREAMAAHVLYADALGQDPITAGDREQVSARLSALLDAKLKAPNLSSVGFRLVGLKELRADSGLAALLVYRDTNGHDVSCYFKRLVDSRGTDFMQMETTRTNVIYRLDEHLGYAVVGALPVSALRKIAEVGYQEISRDGR